MSPSLITGPLARKAQVISTGHFIPRTNQDGIRASVLVAYFGEERADDQLLSLYSALTVPCTSRCSIRPPASVVELAEARLAPSA